MADPRPAKLHDPQPATPLETSESPPTSGPPQSMVVERPSRGRSMAAVICLVLAALLTTPAAVAYWGQRTLNDTERYVDTVGSAGGLAGGPGRHRDQGHGGDPAAGRHRGDPQQRVRRGDHRRGRGSSSSSGPCRRRSTA